jgi:hypothetical protein
MMGRYMTDREHMLLYIICVQAETLDEEEGEWRKRKQQKQEKVHNMKTIYGCNTTHHQ